MWGGDANHNGEVYFYNNGNDKDAILNDYLHGDVNGYNTSYEDGDVNLDGQTYYYNENNDKEWILNHSLSGDANNGYLSEQVP